MSLRKDTSDNATQATAQPSFEPQEGTADLQGNIAVDNDTGEILQPEALQQSTEVPGTEPKTTTTAIAERAPNATAVAIPSRAPAIKDVLAENKDLFRIDFDSLPRIAAEQGIFVMKGDKPEDLGKELDLELVSFQDSYVASPGDNKADIELVKWSDDGVTSRDGTDMKAHVEHLKSIGYTKASMTHRQVTVCELQRVDGKVHAMSGDLVQLDLPDSGRRSFNQYKIQASWKVKKGVLTEEAAKQIRATATKMLSRDNEAYTKAVIGFQRD